MIAWEVLVRILLDNTVGLHRLEVMASVLSHAWMHPLMRRVIREGHQPIQVGTSRTFVLPSLFAGLRIHVSTVLRMVHVRGQQVHAMTHVLKTMFLWTLAATRARSMTQLMCAQLIRSYVSQMIVHGL